jgi:amidase
MNSRDYADCDGLELAARIRHGELSARDALDTAYDVIEKIDSQVNAFVSLEKAQALRNVAALSSGPFTGVPIAMKDCVGFVKGAPRRFGSRLTSVTRMEQDDEVFARYQAAGFNPIGTTNVPEFSSSLTTESRLHGPCRNPWDLTRSVGGSSGGSAAAVAYGAVPVAYGNDSAGSIRIPSSCCGVFGFRPCRGRVPMGPLFGDIWHGLFSHHVITRSVRDSAAVLDVSHGIDAGAPYGAPAPQRPYLAECDTEPGRLRIASMDGSANGIELHSEIVSALEETRSLLRYLGHAVTSAAPAFDSRKMRAHLGTLLAEALAEEVHALAANEQREIGPETVEHCQRLLIERGLHISALDLSRSLNYRHELARLLGRFFGDFDVLLTPTLAVPPVPLGTIDADSSDVDAYLEKLRRFSPFAPMANFAGLPSMSVPICRTPSGLPVGMMFTGGYAEEAMLFRLAGQLERMQPWRDRHPPLSA